MELHAIHQVNFQDQSAQWCIDCILREICNANNKWWSKLLAMGIISHPMRMIVAIAIPSTCCRQKLVFSLRLFRLWENPPNGSLNVKTNMTTIVCFLFTALCSKQIKDNRREYSEIEPLKKNCRFPHKSLIVIIAIKQDSSCFPSLACKSF